MNIKGYKHLILESLFSTRKKNFITFFYINCGHSLDIVQITWLTIKMSFKVDKNLKLAKDFCSSVIVGRLLNMTNKIDNQFIRLKFPLCE